MLEALPLWLHIVAAAVWVGSQVMMFVVVIPSLRLTEILIARHQVLRGVTRRFGYLGLAALILLALTGVDNLDRYAPDDIFHFRYGYILAGKLIMLTIAIGLTAVHALWIGPRLLDLQANVDSIDDGAARMRGLRLKSIATSSMTLVLSLGILFCAALLRSPYAYGAGW
jgi:uncharacterized membrane protein